MDDQLDTLAETIAGADRVIAFTGAGVSTASGIPDFRGDDGIWETQFDPADFNYSRFTRDPAGFWADRLHLHETMFGDDVAPNDAHRALARLEADGHVDAVVTQNTDGLHDDAGTDRLLELHGNASRAVCVDCRSTIEIEAAFDVVRDGDAPPRCDCGGVYKPDVVLFGEQLPTQVYATAQRLAAESDVFVAAGSSLTVNPAAGLPKTALDTGADLAVVNFDETQYSPQATFDLRADVTTALPSLVERLVARA